MRKWLKRIVIGGLITLVGLLGLVWGLAYLYQDDLKAYVEATVQENINRDIAIGQTGIDYSILSHFPNIAVQLPEVRIANPEHVEGKLIDVQEIYIVFDLVSIINGEFIINEIAVSEGSVHIHFDKDGIPNYKIWNDLKEDDKSESEFSIDNISFDGLKFQYSDARKNHDIHLQIEHFQVQPISLKDTFNLKSNIDAVLTSININGFKLDTSIALNGDLNYYALASNSEVIYLGDLLGSSSKVNVGWYKEDEKDKLNLAFDIEEVGISRIVSVLPHEMQNTVLKGASGKVKLDGSLKGKLSNPNVHVNYDLQNGLLNIEGQKLTKVSAKGHFEQPSFTNLKRGKVVVNHMTGSYMNSSFDGTLELENLKSPWVKTKVNCNVDLEEVYTNFLTDQFDDLKGIVNVNAELSGGIKDLIGDKKRKSIRNFKSNGEIHFEGLEVLPKGFSNKIDFQNGDLSFNNKDLQIVQLNGKVNNSQFDMDGKVSNFLNTIFSDAPLTFHANLNIDQLKLEEFITAEGSQAVDSNYYFSLPEDILLDVKLNLGDFKFRKFHAQAIGGGMILKNQRLSFKKMQFNTCSGSALVSGKVEANYSDKVLFECSADLKGIDATMAFTQFENFGQDFLLAKHVKGRITTDIYLLAETDKQLNVLKDKIYTKTKIKIKDGELNSFEPLMELQGFLKEEFNLDFDLKNLKFKTLENDIEVINKKIWIPEMAIHTNDLNMDISGTHTFDQEIDYTFKVKHSDIFKASKENKIDKEYGVIENNDKTATLPLKMTGTVDDPKFSYDTKEKIDIIKENLQKEGKAIINAIKNEFKGSKEKQKEKEDKKKEHDDLNEERSRTTFSVGGIDEDEDDDEDDEEDNEDDYR